MAFRGRGRGRGGFGGGGFYHAKQVPFELFPEIDDLGKAKYSPGNIEPIKWSAGLQKYWNSSPYFIGDRGDRCDKMQNQDIERYSDRKSQITKAKQPLWHFIKLDTDHVPSELARGDRMVKHVPKRVRWNPDSDFQKLDAFEKLEQKFEGQEVTVKKENEEDDEEPAIEESDEESFEAGNDYFQTEVFDDDEDDYNIPEENDDEGEY